MRLAITAIAAMLLLMLAPSEAPARKLRLGPLIGSVHSILRGAIRVRPYVYRPRARFTRRPARTRAAIARRARAAQMAQLGALATPVAFWPDASQDVFDYVLTPREDGLWAHGFGAVVASVFTPPPNADSKPEPKTDARNEQKTDTVAAGEQPAQPAQPEQTVGAAPAGAAASSAQPVCPEDRASHAEAVTDWLRDTLALPADQRVLTQLRTALTRADDQITAGCPRDVPATLPDRLRAMQDRLWAVRVAATNLRASVQDFQNGLTSEQKAKLDAPQSAARESQSRRRAQADMAGKLCYAQAQRAPQWPSEQIARAVRPNKEQQESLAALSETSTKMSMMMMGACPQKPAATPQDRLNVALDWLDNMLFATANVAVAVDDFYGKLSDEQKSKLDTLSL